MNQLRSLIQSPAHKFLLHKQPVCLAKVQASHQPRPRTKQVRKPMPTGLLQVVTLAQVWCANYFRWETNCCPPWDKHGYLYPKETSGWGFRAAFITLSAIYYFTFLFFLLYYFTRFFYPPKKELAGPGGKVQGYVWTHVRASVCMRTMCVCARVLADTLLKLQPQRKQVALRSLVSLLLPGSHKMYQVLYKACCIVDFLGWQRNTFPGISPGKMVQLLLWHLLLLISKLFISTILMIASHKIKRRKYKV